MPLPAPTNRDVMPRDRMIATFGESQHLLPGPVSGGLAGSTRVTYLPTMLTRVP